jgi:hypothetical protein
MIKQIIYYIGQTVIILLILMYVFGGEIHYKINNPQVQLDRILDTIQAFRLR